MLEKFISDMTPLCIASLIGFAFLGLLFWLQWRAGKTETGETTREKGRLSLRVPVAQDAYDAGQTQRDGQIVLARFYRRFGTAEQKERAVADLKKLGIVYL